MSELNYNFSWLITILTDKETYKSTGYTPGQSFRKT